MVSKIAGHTSIKTTQIYMHLLGGEEHKLRAVESLPNYGTVDSPSEKNDDGSRVMSETTMAVLTTPDEGCERMSPGLWLGPSMDLQSRRPRPSWPRRP